MAHEINTPIGVVKGSGKVITQALAQAMVRVPALFEKLDSASRSLFLQLIERATEPTAVLSSREQRAISREIAAALVVAGISDAIRKSDALMQLGVQPDLAEFLQLLQHPECDLILDAAQSIGAIGKSARNINAAVDQVSKIIFALKSFSRSAGNSEMVVAKVQDSIETVLTIYESQIRRGTELVRDITDLAPLRCLPDELTQVWINLIHNALQAMNYEGTLSIGLRQVGHEAVVSVGDTGCGIPENIRDKIFSPFFTTKAIGEGSGLGLDIAKKIVDKHHGRIEVRSEVGVGTTMYVYLPLKGAGT